MQKPVSGWSSQPGSLRLTTRLDHGVTSGELLRERPPVMNITTIITDNVCTALSSGVYKLSALHHPQHALVFTVVGSGLLALRTSRRTPAWLGISCWSFNVKKAAGDLTHHGGLDCPLVPASSGRCRSSVECANHGGASSSVQFSSVQFSSRWYSCARKRP